MPKDRQSRYWFLTENNPEEREIERFKELDCQWIAISKEHEDDDIKTPHIHVAIVFAKKRRWSTLGKLFPRADREVMEGSPQSCVTYMTKENDLLFEKGERPEKEDGRQKGGAKTQEKWKDAIALAKQEKFDEIEEKYPGWWVTHINKFKQIAADAKKDKSMDDVNETDIKKHFLWLYGPAGTGKSHTARRIAKDLGCEDPYLKDLNKWWNGYNHQKVTIIEEASPKACEYLASYFKKWCDKWSFTAECKGTVIPACRPEYIIVTSNYEIDRCFPEAEDNEPIHRRFTEVHLYDRSHMVYWPWSQPEYEEMKREGRDLALPGNIRPVELRSEEEPESNRVPKRRRIEDETGLIDPPAILENTPEDFNSDEINE